MSNIINVDFLAKKKIESFTITPWKCIICLQGFESDSRNVSESKRVFVREATRKKEAEYICKECCLVIAKIAKEENW
jgi:hypothetical protein